MKNSYEFLLIFTVLLALGTSYQEGTDRVRTHVQNLEVRLAGPLHRDGLPWDVQRALEGTSGKSPGPREVPRRTWAAKGRILAFDRDLKFSLFYSFLIVPVD